MLKDNRLLIADNIAITASGVLANSIAFLGPSDLGAGAHQLYLHVRVTTAFSGGTGAALRVAIGSQSGGQLYFVANTGPIATALLVANSYFQVPIGPWPQGPLQVPLDVDSKTLQALATVTTATGTEDGTYAAGRITVEITADPGVAGARNFPVGTGSYTA